MSEDQLRTAVCAEVVRLLRTAREARGLSMNQLARLAGVTQPTISILESSQPNPKLTSLLKLTRALDLNLGVLIQQALANVESPPRPRSKAKATRTSSRSRR
ncbi:MAG TPA: helix-turn-helix transcriptional regulator [Verrucomicrobiota bacterium]|nr:helix-turn-helix transcriptional regulator [Verrucomicrobiota bacterium]